MHNINFIYKMFKILCIRGGTSPSPSKLSSHLHALPSTGSSLIRFICSLSVSSRPILFIIAGRNLTSTFGPLKNIKYYHPKCYTIIISGSNRLLKKGFLSEEKLKTVKYMYTESRGITCHIYWLTQKCGYIFYNLRMSQKRRE